MATAKNGLDLTKLIKEEVNLKMNTKIKKDVVNIYERIIGSEVYGAYKPRRYKRRFSLLHNVDSKFDENDSRLTVWTVGIPNTSSPYFGIPNNLLELIEYGHGYNGNEYNFYEKDTGSREYAKPRPFNRTAYEIVKTMDFQRYFN